MNEAEYLSNHPLNSYIFETTQEYMDKIKYIDFNAMTSEDKKLMYCAREFFQGNFESFSNDEIETFLKLPNFKKNMDPKTRDQILNYYISENRPCPVLISGWVQHNNENLVKYIKILNEQNEVEQLTEIYRKQTAIVLDFYKTIDYQSEHLINLVLKDKPHYIFFNKRWDEDKICEFLDTQPNNNEIFTAFLNNPHSSIKIQDKFFTKIINDLRKDKKTILDNDNLLNSHQSNLISYFTKLPFSFIEKFSELDYKLLYQFLAQPVILNTQSSETAQMSNLQIIYFNKSINKPEDAKELLNLYKNEIFQPVEQKIHNYPCKVDIDDYFFRKRDWAFFLPLANHYENLSTKQQHFFNAATFNSYMENKFVDYTDNRITNAFKAIPSHLLDTYYSHLKPAIKNKELIPKINKFILNIKLDSELKDNNNNQKNIKI